MIYIPQGEMTEAEQVCYDAGWLTPLQALTIRTALNDIAGGKGEFSTDRLQHATNVIDNARRIAKETLALLSPEAQLGEDE